ncbi:hypothetical protein MMC11_006408 [Xylographa trunciseda]|nr:hypothetical protein [Xylographa trunciseda]
MPSSKPEISKPIFDETRGTWSLRSNAPEGHPQTRLDRGRLDEEHGSVHTETEEGTHPGRALSFGQDPPLTAPATYAEAGPPQWKNIYYGDRSANEPQTERQVIPPGIYRPAPGRNASPPQLEIYTPRPEMLSPRTPYPYAQDGASSATIATGRAGLDTLRGMPRIPIPGPANAIDLNEDDIPVKVLFEDAVKLLHRDANAIHQTTEHFAFRVVKLEKVVQNGLQASLGFTEIEDAVELLIKADQYTATDKAPCDTDGMNRVVEDWWARFGLFKARWIALDMVLKLLINLKDSMVFPYSFDPLLYSGTGTCFII